MTRRKKRRRSTSPPADGSRRLDAAVRERFALSWTRARERIERGKIFIDGAPVTDIGCRLAEGVEFEYVEDARRSRLEDELLPPRALREVDGDIVVVDKPADLLTVPFERDDRDTVVRLLGLVLARRERTGTARVPLYVVHRLDRGTSGLLVFARNRRARDRLKDQFRAHTVERRYIALVEGHIAPQTVKTHLVRDRGDGVRGSAERASARAQRKLSGGRIAITHVEVVEKLRDSTLVACRLETGRTNQIRIHLSELGHPVVGETVYAGKGELTRASRLCLHAASLGFVHPKTGQALSFESKVPGPMLREIEARRCHA